MVIVGLLIVALVCLALGLILPSTAWLIASLIASVGAGYVLFRARTLIAGAHAVEAGGAAASTGAATAVLDREPAAEAESEPRRTRAQSRAEARAAKAAAAAEVAETSETAAAEHEGEFAEHDTVQLDRAVDTQHDRYEAPTELIEPVSVADSDHTVEVSGGELLAGVTDDAASTEPAHPDDDVVAESPLEANEGDVWVIDGRPRYHLATCAIIQGQDAEPIPFEQATEDGFMPCSLCEPNVVRATA